MYYPALILLLVSFAWTCLRVLLSETTSRSSGKLPPGPRPFPVVGNIFSLSSKPHVSLADLSKTYGPVMSLKLGTITSVVISSPQAAREALQKHDRALSGRTVTDSVRALRHHEASVVWLPESATRWRELRKICALQLFSPQRLEAGRALRREKVREIVDHVGERCRSGTAVDIGEAAFTTTLNLLSNTIFSVDLATYDSERSQEFMGLVRSVMEEAGVLNLADYFPALRWIDPQGARRRTTVYARKLLGIFDEIINQRLAARGSSSSKENSPARNVDVLDALLDLSKEPSDYELSCDDMKHLFLDLFVAGTDTTSSTVEWAMAELLCHPEVMARAQAELKQISDQDDKDKGEIKIIEESEISKLPYLQAVVKETFRLHPPVPFLVPHKAEASVEIMGYRVPKGAQVLVNVWDVGHNADTWERPNSFSPERFLSPEAADVKGMDFELIPFGAGRRICPGLPLAQRMVHVMLASLMGRFEWKLGGEELDMEEKYGITLRKAEPLRAIPIQS
ncbi:cytochrome P450 76T24-like [Malania oleifera]|uniref:cytochrome P450 76T24-like n=1 Tax=Malania oleifera TaxID=397392 RepID=UPI0025AE2524|nr:cytochrome P450 76T24-like [Malania oleifera]